MKNPTKRWDFFFSFSDLWVFWGVAALNRRIFDSTEIFFYRQPCGRVM
ncbi:MAG: hypothetical protein WA821_23345 [Anaerolineales bacterium]